MSKASQEIADEVEKELELNQKPSESIVCNRCEDEYCPGAMQCKKVQA